MKTLLTAAASLVLGSSLTFLAPESPQEAQPLDVQAGDYAVDGTHSSLVFGIRHLDVSNFYGRFNSIGGRFSLDPDDWSASSVEIVVDPASIDTGSGGRDKHVKNPDFLDVENHDLLGFRSQAVRELSPRHLEVDGNLTLHGVSQPVTATVELVGAGETSFGDYRAGVEARFTVKRSDFGMDAMLDKLGDEITILLSVEGVRQAD